MATKDKGDFNNNHGKPGWVYVARNDLLREDIYKVGCTVSSSPETRTTSLNTEQRSGTSRIGFFNLIYAAAVFDAQGCEAALLRRLEVLKESRGKEFVNAPLDLIIGEILYIQSRDLRDFSATANCPSCGAVAIYPPHPFVWHPCSHCSSKFVHLAPGILRHADHRDPHTLVYSAIDKLKPAHHSPLAAAFIGLRDDLREYLHGSLTDDEASVRFEHWTALEPPLDRAPLLYQKPVARKRQGIPRARTLKTRSGWIECANCLASIKPDADGVAICLECGWSNENS